MIALAPRWRKRWRCNRDEVAAFKGFSISASGACCGVPGCPISQAGCDGYDSYAARLPAVPLKAATLEAFSTAVPHRQADGNHSSAELSYLENVVPGFSFRPQDLPASSSPFKRRSDDPYVILDVTDMDLAHDQAPIPQAGARQSSGQANCRRCSRRNGDPGDQPPGAHQCGL